MQEEGSTSTLEVTEAEGGQKLMQFLQRRLSLPQAMLHRWVRTGQIRRNGGRCKPFDHVHTGDMVRLPPFALAMHRSAVGSPSPHPPHTPHPAQDWGDLADSAAPAANTTHADSADPHSALLATAFSCATDSTQAASPTPPCPAAAATQASSSATHPAARGDGPSCAAPKDDALAILHAQGYLLVLNKPAGLPVHPGTGHSDSIATRLAACYADAPFRPTPAHRLDKDTSGLLLAASAYSVLRALQDAFRHRHMVKEYVAWVHGAWAGDEPVLLRHSLAKKYEGWDEKMRVLTTPDPVSAAKGDAAAAEGKEAVCVVRCLRREIDPHIQPHAHSQGQTQSQPPIQPHTQPPIQSQGHTRPQAPYYGARSLVQVRLITGRTHQIRAQLAAVGHPLCGDFKYGAPEQQGRTAPATPPPASSRTSAFPAPARPAVTPRDAAPGATARSGAPRPDSALARSFSPDSTSPDSFSPDSTSPHCTSPHSALSALPFPAPGRSAPVAEGTPPAPVQQPTLYLHSLRIMLPDVAELAHLPREYTVLPPWRGREALHELPPPLTVPEL